MTQVAQQSQPTVLLVVGMAGSGKTTFINTLSSRLASAGTPPYIINLDPAVASVPYLPNIDIRDNVSYSSVRKDYNLGPNGGIVTCLNLYATRFHQVIQLIEARRGKHKFVLIDTPGQIEVFTWSASGTVITDLLASSFPCCVLYITDCSSSSNPVTFMSNMLYTCSMLYKFNLPFLLCLNKCDVDGSQVVRRWIEDSDLYGEALDEDPSYAANLSRSLSLVLEKFYEVVERVCVSSTVGTGFGDLLPLLGRLRELYFTDFRGRRVDRRGMGDTVEVGTVLEEELPREELDEESLLDAQFMKSARFN